jgi:hypothetical protein
MTLDAEFIVLDIVMLTDIKPHCAECRYAECRYAECRYAECRYAECRVAFLSSFKVIGTISDNV